MSITHEDVLEAIAEAVAPLEARISALEAIPTVKAHIEIEAIQTLVADHFHLRIGDMRSKARPDSIARPRQIAMYFSKMFTRSTLVEIGIAFGNRDHGTVIHACRAVERMINQEAHMRDSINHLRGVLAERIK